MVSAAALTATTTAPAALRCELSMQENSSGTACIDPSALDGKTVEIPSNVTRIGQDGLSLCTLHHTSNRASDIAYIIDNSNSMDAWGFWISSAGDTSFYIPNCSTYVSGTKVPLRRRHFGASGTDSSWDTLVEISSGSIPSSISSKCYEANDPYSMRAEVVRVAMNYQASLDSGSQAGMLEFNSKIQQSSPMRTLQGSGLSRLLDSTGLYNAASGTNWTAPLSTTFGWLAGSTNSVKAVIFVSDGEPQDESNYRSFLHSSSSSVPVYGIYLGSGISDVPEMDSLTGITGGQYWIVPPDRPDSLQSVIRAIVGTVMSVETPARTTITNLTNGQSSTALSLTETSNGSFQAILDSVISLGTGKNSIQLISSWTDSKGSTSSDTSAFILNVSGSAATASGAISGDSIFATTCSEASTLAFLSTTSRTAVDTVSESDGSFMLALSSTEALTFPVPLRISETAGDTETLKLLTRNLLTSGTYTGTMNFSVSRPWSHTSADGILQTVSSTDTVTGSWCYPRDSRDCAEDTLIIIAQRAPYIQWIPGTAPGTAGSLLLRASLPGETKESVSALIFRDGKKLANVTLNRESDSIFSHTVNFRQGGSATGSDSLWISSPTAADSLVASVTWSLNDSVLYDTAVITRTAPELSLTGLSSDSLTMILSASAQPDTRGTRTVILRTDSTQITASLDSLSGNISTLKLLSAAPDGSALTVTGTFIDPVFGDTASDTILLTVPSRSLRFIKPELIGPDGVLELEVTDPYVTGSSVEVVILHGATSTTVTLARSESSVFLGSLPFTQRTSAAGDTLALGPNGGHTDSVFAMLAASGAHATIIDTATISRPTLSLSFTHNPALAQGVLISLAGATSDTTGGAVTILTAPVTDHAELTAGTIPLSWSGSVNLTGRLEESLDSAVVTGFFVDPLYGDTARASLRIASPWYPGSISISRDTIDPRSDSFLIVAVRDHDPDSLTVGSVTVTIGSQSWTLPETSISSGEYQIAIPDSLVDPLWKTHESRTCWQLILQYQDPLHPADISKDTVTLRYTVPPSEISVHQPYTDLSYLSSFTGSEPLTVVPQADTIFHDNAPYATTTSMPSISVRTWETTHAIFHIYDQIGTAVTSWEGDISSVDPKKGSLYLICWNGRDTAGRLAGPGVYLVRVVRYSSEGRCIGNAVLHIGLH